MMIQINKKYAGFNKLLKDQVNVIFSDENGSLDNLKTLLTKNQKKFIQKKIKNKIKGNKFLFFDLTDNIQLSIILVSKNPSFLEIQKLGAEFFLFLKKNKIQRLTIFDNNNNFINLNLIEYLIHGLKTKSYSFEIYKTKKNKEKINISLITKNKKNTIKTSKNLEALLEGINLTKDLVSEPGNILHPDEYVKRLIKLKKIGLKINVYDKKKLKKLGCNAILGVGQGSVRGSYLVTLEWKGKKI